MELTKQALTKICRDNGLYSSPALNDKLYLHYKGIRQIRNLEEYTGLRVLWLEGNGLCKLEGMEALTAMRTLYAHENLIEKIEGLDMLQEESYCTAALDTLNLCKNFIRCVENISHLSRLTTLLLAHNHLETADDVRHVLLCPSIQTLDLQHNRINDPQVVNVVSAMDDLRVLYLQGNPVVKHIRHYRKTIVSECTVLKYLDDRPVFDEERRRCEAWSRGMATGGLSRAQEAEREEMKIIRDAKKEAEERQYKAFETMIREGLEARRRKKENAHDADDVRTPITRRWQTSRGHLQSYKEVRGILCRMCTSVETASELFQTCPILTKGGPANNDQVPGDQMESTTETASVSDSSFYATTTHARTYVNENSSEWIVPFNDCETVRNARRHRVAHILETPPAPPVTGANSEEDTQSLPGSSTEIHIQATPLDEDLDPVQLAKDVDDEICAFEKKTNRLRQNRIIGAHNNPSPLPPA
ncbi:unnamed protein product, partial [Ascophyllum nodosum]